MDTATISGAIILRASTISFSRSESAILSQSGPRLSVRSPPEGPTNTHGKRGSSDPSSLPSLVRTSRLKKLNRTTLRVAPASTTNAGTGSVSGKRSDCFGISRLTPSGSRCSMYWPTEMFNCIEWLPPFADRTIGSRISENAGNPLKSPPKCVRSSLFKDPFVSSSRPKSSSRYRTILARTAGEASEASIRNASRTDDFPVLFFPVIRLTRPKPLSFRDRNDLNRSIESVEIVEFISVVSVEATYNATGSHFQPILRKRWRARSAIDATRAAPPAIPAGRPVPSARLSAA